MVEVEVRVREEVAGNGHVVEAVRGERVVSAQHLVEIVSPEVVTDPGHDEDESVGLGGEALVPGNVMLARDTREQQRQENGRNTNDEANLGVGPLIKSLH